MPRHTPEVEARRIAAVRAALTGRRKPESQLKNMAEGIRKYWLGVKDGTIAPPPRNPETYKKIGDKLRGRKRPAELVARIHALQVGQKRTEEQKANMSRAAKEAWASGRAVHGKIPEDKRDAWKAKISASNMGRRPSDKWRESMTGRKWSEEVVESRVAPLRGRAQKAEATRKGPTNQMSLHVVFRSPENIVYEAHNVTHFVRENEDLFAPEEVQWDKPNQGGRCVASRGLLRLTAKSQTRGTWKGWTLVSMTEVICNEGQDLLKRSILGPQVAPATASDQPK